MQVCCSSKHRGECVAEGVEAEAARLMDSALSSSTLRKSGWKDGLQFGVGIALCFLVLEELEGCSV